MLRKTISSVLAAMFVTVLFGSITGCNTMSGAGQDIKEGGEKIKQEADEHK